MKLNLGSGDLPAPPPWVNVDSWPGCRPDVVADLCRLPWPDRTVSHVYCGHVLEHLDKPAVLRALCEIRRVLQPDGRLCVVGPDLDRALDDDPVDEVLVDVIRHGGDRWPGDRHRWEPTAIETLRLVRQLFPTSHTVPVSMVDAVWPVAFRHPTWQCAVTA